MIRKSFPPYSNKLISKAEIEPPLLFLSYQTSHSESWWVFIPLLAQFCQHSQHFNGSENILAYQDNRKVAEGISKFHRSWLSTLVWKEARDGAAKCNHCYSSTNPHQYFLQSLWICVSLHWYARCLGGRGGRQGYSLIFISKKDKKKIRITILYVSLTSGFNGL